MISVMLTSLPVPLSFSFSPEFSIDLICSVLMTVSREDVFTTNNEQTTNAKYNVIFIFRSVGKKKSFEKVDFKLINDGHTPLNVSLNINFYFGLFCNTCRFHNVKAEISQYLSFYHRNFFNGAQLLNYRQIKVGLSKLRYSEHIKL
jgi:hypothetical protein